MEDIHHLSSTADTKMDAATKGCKKKMKKTQSDCLAGLPDETQQCLTIYENFSSRRLSKRSKPRLQSTKSFPPYSRCIGGLGEDKDREEESESHEPSLRHEEKIMDQEVGGGRKEDSRVNGRQLREEVRAKWRMRRKERAGGSCEVDTDGWERWSGKRRVEEGEESDEGQPCKGRNSSFEAGGEEEEGGEEKNKTGVQGGIKETLELKEEEAEGLLGVREGLMTHQWSAPHPILSRLLQSSSSTSPCSSISLSSAESDEVFSEEESGGSKRRTLRKVQVICMGLKEDFDKCRSWKTYLTIMHWSLRRQSSWVQLAGHQGNFQVSEGGEVLKLYSEVEAKCLDLLMKDPLRPFVPQYHGLVTREEHCYIRLEDLLSGLRRPCIMDCKMGVRTYQEDEIIKSRMKASLRTDMYQKMVKIDPSAPSAEEHAQKGVTKLRYLQWRDTTTSTSTLGFRIEGVMMEDGSIQRDFRKIKSVAQVTEAMLYFTRGQLDILRAYHSRLLSLSEALKDSVFFRTHEVIGSSLLFVHDYSSKASVWMIDFGKTTPVPDTCELLHNVPWTEGSREDGYLIGLTSLISSLSRAIVLASWQPLEERMESPEMNPRTVGHKNSAIQDQD